jgi:hypothetical protein
MTNLTKGASKLNIRDVGRVRGNRATERIGKRDVRDRRGERGKDESRSLFFPKKEKAKFGVGGGSNRDEIDVAHASWCVVFIIK